MCHGGRCCCNNFFGCRNLFRVQQDRASTRTSNSLDALGHVARNQSVLCSQKISLETMCFGLFWTGLARLGPSWACLRLVLGNLGLFWTALIPKKLKTHFLFVFSHMQVFNTLKLLMACLGPSWSMLGLSWACLGSVLGHLGPVLGHLGLVLGYLNASWACPGPVLGCLGPVLGNLGRVLGLSWAILGCLGRL